MKNAEFRMKERRAAGAETVRKQARAAKEDRIDVAAARKALAESEERIPYEKVRGELGLESSRKRVAWKASET
jgi:predicted nucleic acid-binding protein